MDKVPQDNLAEQSQSTLFEHINITNDFRAANEKSYGRGTLTPVNIFDKAGAQAVKDEAIAQVDENALPDWRECFEQAIRLTAERMPIFNADHIWQTLEQLPDVPEQHERRAAGPCIMRAVKAGTIKFTGRFESSSRKHCHAMPIRIYESQIYQGVSN